MRLFGQVVQVIAFIGCRGLLGAEWYVSPTGDDSGAGTIEAPSASFREAQLVVRPGDTVFLRGGTYRLTEKYLTRRRGLFARIIVLDKSGDVDIPITLRTYRPCDFCTPHKEAASLTRVFLFDETTPISERLATLN